ncbi:uncharacterized protein [Physcomitrium patens]|uniref:No apical meristem-associated C-terminal domain-containing protein n=1 Tax=Physcomitrium patens TaxID=3218 RepID=A0A2K1J1M3_PHYPA|nr:uncharacterized protein LOC112294939 [Physcomitrium patens]XP_024401722.1 uncharacterized protein LOC112294939 [Physcomitrium patens]PNR35417.1 hypothetical protein PHYPA_023317 [Physcomitrium patens]|eukprot:XP_024401721.1 uncharacterized protein LOC112294939 [Physcomitrella patens]
MALVSVDGGAGVVEAEAASTATRNRKGMLYVAAEETQLCRSYLHVLQDSGVENKQKAGSFWHRVQVHYNCNRPQGCGERPARSLETKWGMIKHDVAKFIENYGAVRAEAESGTSSEEMLQKALELYRSRHPSNQSFTFIHCWLVLKDAPRWKDAREDVRKTPPVKRKNPGASTDLDKGEVEMIDAMREEIRDDVLKKPLPMKRKSEVEMINAIKAQARATADMAAATRMKIAILEEQNVMALFTVPEEQLVSEEAREYFKLRRGEELRKLRARLEVTSMAPVSTEAHETSRNCCARNNITTEF